MNQSQGATRRDASKAPRPSLGALSGLALALTLSAGSACSALVGEQCAAGYVTDGDVCIPDGKASHTPGQGVFLGMDFSAIAPLTHEAHLLGNAVFLASHRPVRILDYRALTDWNASSVTNVTDLIADEAVARRHTVQTTVAKDAADVVRQLDLGEIDVLFVHDQVDAPPGMLAEIGASWAPAIDHFLARSGVVVVTATTHGRNEMGDLLSASGLLSVASLAPTTDGAVSDVGLSDPVGHNVGMPLRGQQALAYFVLTDPTEQHASTVLFTPPSRPVVVHTSR